MSAMSLILLQPLQSPTDYQSTASRLGRMEWCHSPLAVVRPAGYDRSMVDDLAAQLHTRNVRDSFGRTSVEYIESRSILTPTSGFMGQYKFTLNPYSGCGFGCEYCYAKFFASSASRRETWGEWVSVKVNAVELMADACRSGALISGDPVYMSSVTDPYQPIERRLGLTRAVLKTMLRSGVQPRLTIQTRSPLVTRDIDLFSAVRQNSCQSDYQC